MSQTGFQIQCWSRASASANEPLQEGATGQPNAGLYAGCYRQYAYFSPVDTQATCAASGYFDSVAFDLTTGDFLQIYSNTESSLVNYYVTSNESIDPSTTLVPTITLSPIGGNVSLTDVPITLAQFLGAYAAPYEILPAPGTGLAYVNVAAIMIMTYGSAQFANGGASFLQYGSTADGAGEAATSSVSAASINGLTASTTWAYNPGPGATIATAGGVANVGIYLTNGSGAFITGTGASFKMNIRANIISAT